MTDSAKMFLRMPVYRVKEDGDGKEKSGRPLLASSINFGNRGSTKAGWQVDDAHDKLTNGNFVRTEANQSKQDWIKYSAGQKVMPETKSTVTYSKA